MWRCFRRLHEGAGRTGICSTHVEMFLDEVLEVVPLCHLLHACGDVSGRAHRPPSGCGSAPRMWRCFFDKKLVNSTLKICSTHVEMFLLILSKSQINSHLLHACGDVSPFVLYLDFGWKSAPRMWRCFLPFLRWRHSKAICSTHVEMFLDEIHLKLAAKDLLHACGDVSLYELVDWRYSQSALRMWRCFPV